MKQSQTRYPMVLILALCVVAWPYPMFCAQALGATKDKPTPEAQKPRLKRMDAVTPTEPSSSQAVTPSQAAGTSRTRRMPKEAAIDTNKDGTPDRWEYYDDQGLPLRIESDSNFDGSVDEWARFEGGKLVKVEKDSDYDGKVDQWHSY